MKAMQKLAILALGVVMLSTAFVGVASAQQYPDVTHLNPFTAESNFMSLPGYLRYASYRHTGVWITYAEAVHITQ